VDRESFALLPFLLAIVICPSDLWPEMNICSLRDPRASQRVCGSLAPPYASLPAAVHADARDFFLPQSIETGCGAHWATYSEGVVSCYPVAKASEEWSWPLSLIWYGRKEFLELYLHSSHMPSCRVHGKLYLYYVFRSTHAYLRVFYLHASHAVYVLMVIVCSRAEHHHLGPDADVFCLSQISAGQFNFVLVEITNLDIKWYASVSGLCRWY
jgi:hypothetical protein